MPLSQSEHECYLSYFIKCNANHHWHFKNKKQLYHTLIWDNWVLRPREKQMSVIPARFISSFCLSFFYYLLLENLEWTKANRYYFQHQHQFFYILLKRYIFCIIIRLTLRCYIHKMNCFIIYWFPWMFLMHPIYWDILYDTSHFCLKHIKINQICV